MKKPFIAQDNPGLRGLAIGNAAIARGAFEAGVKVGSGYPGTPSTEILENFANIAGVYPEHDIQVEWSINEKVGFEVAFGGSMCNARSIATMKHVGVNVAIDSVMSACYAGVKGGLVLITADDPSLHSSQNEQDNRFYGEQGSVPVFEPSNIQEAKDMMKYAYEFSEKYQTLVIYRTTTRINHARGDLVLGEIEVQERDYKFDESLHDQWVHTHENAIENRRRMLERLDKITAAAENFPFTFVNQIEGAEIGIISSGIPFAHTIDALEFLGLNDKVSTLKLGMVYPFPHKKIGDFLKKHKKIVVVEELEPFIEEHIRAIAYDQGIEVEIHGKDIFPRAFEFYPEIIVNNLANFLGMDSPLKILDKTKYLQAPPRPPVLCPGCGHRNIYTAVRQVERRQRLRLIHSSDIGCYTLGFYEPLNGIDTCIAMGASVGLANGFANLDQRTSYAFLGDSTFYHSGLAGLINAVVNNNDLIVVIMDNGSTSMTGHQDHPGTGIKINKQPGQKIDFVNLVLGLGVPRDHIWVPDANNLPAMESAFEDALSKSGVRVVIPTTDCALLRVGWAKKGKIPPLDKQTIDNDKCCVGEYCLRWLGCPAMSIKDGKITINPTDCAGCTMCSQICPYYAIHSINDKNKKK